MYIFTISDVQYMNTIIQTKMIKTNNFNETIIDQKTHGGDNGESGAIFFSYLVLNFDCGANEL